MSSMNRWDSADRSVRAMHSARPYDKNLDEYKIIVLIRRIYSHGFNIAFFSPSPNENVNVIIFTKHNISYNLLDFITRRDSIKITLQYNRCGVNNVFRCPPSAHVKPSSTAPMLFLEFVRTRCSLLNTVSERFSHENAFRSGSLSIHRIPPTAFDTISTTV